MGTVLFKRLLSQAFYRRDGGPLHLYLVVHAKKKLAAALQFILM